MEIERQWLIEKFPDDEGLSCIHTALVRQGYVSVAPTVRIRESIDENNNCKYILCFKGKQKLARQEIEIEITKEKFTELCVFTGNNLITKNYKVYALPTGEKLEVSLVDEGTQNAFYYAEVEFESVEKANAFVAPSFLGEEKTYDNAFSMNAYWQKTRL